MELVGLSRARALAPGWEQMSTDVLIWPIVFCGAVYAASTPKGSLLAMRQTTARPQLLTVAQAASLLNVSEKTIRRWVSAEKVPYVKLPSGGLRIPQGPLFASLQGTHDLAGELAELDERHAGVSEDAVRAAMTDDT